MRALGLERREKRKMPVEIVRPVATASELCLRAGACGELRNDTLRCRDPVVFDLIWGKGEELRQIPRAGIARGARGDHRTEHALREASRVASWLVSLHLSGRTGRNAWRRGWCEALRRFRFALDLRHSVQHLEGEAQPALTHDTRAGRRASEAPITKYA